MIFFDYTKKLNKNSDLYKFMSSTLQNLYKQLKLQKNKKNNLISLTEKLSNINIKNSSNINTTSLLSIIEELKSCLDNVRSNIEDINKLIKDLKDALDSIDNPNHLNSNVNLSLFYTLYIEKQNVILEREIKTDSLLDQAYNFINTSNLPINITISEIQSSFQNISNSENPIGQNPPNHNLNAEEENDTNISGNKNNKSEEIKPEIKENNSNEENSVAKTIDSTKETPLSSDNEIKKNNELAEINSIDTSSILKDNNTLTISETQKKVFLPYKISELEKILQKHPKKYSSLEDLINKEYIFPLGKFKNSNLSRFKEGYSLMRNREKASLGKCLDLAFELTFESNLNPAVIAACRNLDELDIYLDCLDDMALDDFKIFDIKYEIPPTVQA